MAVISVPVRWEYTFMYSSAILRDKRQFYENVALFTGVIVPYDRKRSKENYQKYKIFMNFF
jgi:hypothetical protein